jgi:hypothetical protein
MLLLLYSLIIAKKEEEKCVRVFVMMDRSVWKGKLFSGGIVDTFVCAVSFFLACRRDHFHSTMTTHRTLVKYYYAHATDVFPSSCLLRATTATTRKGKVSHEFTPADDDRPQFFLSVVVLSFELITGLREKIRL